MSVKTCYFFRCKTPHEWNPGDIVEAGTYIGNGGQIGVPFERAQMFVESTLDKNVEMYFPTDGNWEIVSLSVSANHPKPSDK